MECNKEEARRAIDLAEKKISDNDYDEAKKLINKAQRLYPELGDGLKQVLIMINVFIAATNKINGEADWYGVLGADPLADDEALKKQYKKLALLLHPDKNRFNGAEGAFKLVSQAWDLLSNKARRIAYDQKKRRNQPKAENQAQEIFKRCLEKSKEIFAEAVAAAAARENAKSTIRKAERLSKKRTTNSTFEEERLSKKPVTTGNTNSTHEPEMPF